MRDSYLTVDSNDLEKFELEKPDSKTDKSKAYIFDH